MSTQRRLNKPLWLRAIDIVAALAPWATLPLRFSTGSWWFRYEGIHTEYFVLLGLSSALSWIRFMADSFKFSSALGPLVLMVYSMLQRDVLPFLVVYACFFCTSLTLLLGIYRGMGADTTVWDIGPVLFRFTINPDNSYFETLEVDETGARIGGFLNVAANVVQVVWIVLANVRQNRNCAPPSRHIRRPTRARVRAF